jgi:hypothetical protein
LPNVHVQCSSTKIEENQKQRPADHQKTMNQQQQQRFYYTFPLTRSPDEEGEEKTPKLEEVGGKGKSSRLSISFLFF